MANRIRMYLSLAIIFIISWLDVHFVGNHINNIIPTQYHQFIHLLALVIVMYIGYYNWKFYPGKWLKYLWSLAYCMVIAVLMVTELMFLLKIQMSIEYKAFVAQLRNWFIWPIFFIIFSFLPSLAKKDKTE